MRVVSLVPSVTETLTAWGLPPVACTRFCERPDLPAVGGTKNPDVAAIAALAPDVVVMDVEENRRQDHDDLVAMGVDVHVLAVRDVADVAVQMAGLARRVGADRRRHPGRSPAPAAAAGGDGVRRRAFVPIWRRPWMALGPRTYGSSLLSLIGLDTVVSGPDRYPEVDLRQVADLGPDLVVAPSEPYPFGERHVAELSTVAPVVLVDGKDLFWWGSRTPAAVDRLRAALGR